MLSIGHRTCNLQVADSSPGWGPWRSGLGTPLCRCHQAV